MNSTVLPELHSKMWLSEFKLRSMEARDPAFGVFFPLVGSGVALNFLPHFLGVSE